MKKPTLLFFAGAAALITLALWTSGVRASVNAPTRSFTLPIDPAESLLNRTCVVTVDPLQILNPVTAGTQNIVTGFRAPNTVEGILVRMDANWLVLSAPYYENWIPTSKVIMIHARK